MLENKDKFLLFKKRIINKLQNGDESVFEEFMSRLSYESQFWDNSKIIIEKFNHLKESSQRREISKEAYDVEFSRLNYEAYDIMKQLTLKDLKEDKHNFEVQNLREALLVIEELKKNKERLEQELLELYNLKETINIELHDKILENNQLHEKLNRK